MTYPADEGGSGSGGFILGPLDNLFGTNSGDFNNPGSVTPAPDLSTAETTRDTYGLANPGWLAQYDADVNLTIWLSYDDSGNTVFLSQSRTSGVWATKSTGVAIQGETGAPGASGNSYFFPSVQARDDFFSTGNAFQLLMTDLPVMTGDNGTLTPWIWIGQDSPGAYDPSLFDYSTLQVEGKGLFLAENQLVNSLRALSHIYSDGLNNLVLQQPFNINGSEDPYIYVIDSEQVSIVLPVTGTTVSGLLQTFLPVTSNLIQTGFQLNPQTTGSFSVKIYEGLNNNSIPFYSENFTVSVTGFQSFALERPIVYSNPTNVFLEIEGLDFDGGLQPTGTDFPQLSIINHDYETQRILDNRDFIVLDNAILGRDSLSYKQNFLDYFLVAGAPSNNGEVEFSLNIGGVSTLNIQSLNQAQDFSFSTLKQGSLVRIENTNTPNIFAFGSIISDQVYGSSVFDLSFVTFGSNGTLNIGDDITVRISNYQPDIPFVSSLFGLPEELYDLNVLSNSGEGPFSVYYNIHNNNDWSTIVITASRGLESTIIATNWGNDIDTWVGYNDTFNSTLSFSDAGIADLQNGTGDILLTAIARDENNETISTFFLGAIRVKELSPTPPIDTGDTWRNPQDNLVYFYDESTSTWLSEQKFSFTFWENGNAAVGVFFFGPGNMRTSTVRGQPIPVNVRLLSFSMSRDAGSNAGPVDLTSGPVGGPFIPVGSCIFGGETSISEVPVDSPADLVSGETLTAQWNGAGPTNDTTLIIDYRKVFI